MTRDEVETTCRSASTLTRRELDARGWTATIDGRAVPLGWLDGIFQVVAVPEGTAKIRFLFRPFMHRWFVALIMLGVLLIGIDHRVARSHRRSVSALPVRPAARS